MKMGLAIRVRRTMREMHLEDLARKAGISVSYLSLIETGKRDPSISVVIKLADELGIRMSALCILAENLEELP